MDTIWNRRQDETHPSPYSCKKIGGKQIKDDCKSPYSHWIWCDQQSGNQSSCSQSPTRAVSSKFGENTFATDLVQAEKYLVNVVQAKSTCMCNVWWTDIQYLHFKEQDIDGITTYFFHDPRPPLALSLFCSSLCHTSGFRNKWIVASELRMEASEWNAFAGKEPDFNPRRIYIDLCLQKRVHARM